MGVSCFSFDVASDIVITGLQDRVERVRDACKEMINDSWLPRAKKLETLLAFLGVESDDVCGEKERRRERERILSTFPSLFFTLRGNISRFYIINFVFKIIK